MRLFKVCRCIYFVHESLYWHVDWRIDHSVALSSLWPEKPSIDTTDSRRLQIQPEYFPPVFFLDSQVVQRNRVAIPKITMPLPPYVMDFTGDPRLVGEKFFATIHKWMSFVSKKRFYENLLNPLTQPRADTTLLIFCMKLIMWQPSEQTNKNAKTSIYLFAKRSLLEAEVAGMLSIHILQAWILVTIYELGHAIFPSAYMSIATCARYGSLLDPIVTGLWHSKNHLFGWRWRSDGELGGLL